eukprot:jgi/Mesvir1/20629/Mv14855-RA.1
MAQIPPTYHPPDWCGTPPRGATEDSQPGFTLEIVKEGSVVEKMPLDQKKCYTLGRAPTCDVLLDHPSVSRQHAAILHRRSDGCVLLTDLRSAHGTKVGGKPLAPQQAELLLGAGQRRSAPFVLGASTRAYHVVRGGEGADAGSCTGGPAVATTPLPADKGASSINPSVFAPACAREAGAGDAARAPELACGKAGSASLSAASPAATSTAPATGAGAAAGAAGAINSTAAAVTSTPGANAATTAAAAGGMASESPGSAAAAAGAEEAAPASRKRRERGKSRWSDSPAAEATAAPASSGVELHAPAAAVATSAAVNAGVLQAAALAAMAASRDATGGGAPGLALGSGAAGHAFGAAQLQAVAAQAAAGQVAVAQNASAIAQLAMQRAAKISAGMAVGGGDKKSLEEKKKLLWAGKKAAAEAAPKPESLYGHNRWDTAEFSDPSKREKFQKLMGMKSAPAGGAPPAAPAPPPASGIMTEHAQHDLSHHLEHQFESGLRRRGGNTLGLGL